MRNEHFKVTYLNPTFDMRDPIQAAEALGYRGQNGQLSGRRSSETDIAAYWHDGIVFGGIPFLGAIGVDNVVTGASLVGNNLELVGPNGFLASADLSALLDNVNIVPGTYALVDGTMSVPLTNGSFMSLDGSVFATDADLAAAIAALDAEQYIASLTVDANGNSTLIDNNGATVGVVTDNNIIPANYVMTQALNQLALEDGTSVGLDLSAFATIADLNAAIASLAAEEYLQQPVLVGTTIAFPMASGATYNLSLASVLGAVDEDFIDNGDGTYTFVDGDGSQVTVAGDTDDQSITSPDSSISVIALVQPNGQVDYAVATDAARIPAVNPITGALSTVQAALTEINNNLAGRVTTIEAQMPDDHVVGASVSGTNLTLQKSDGSNIVVSLGAFANAPDVQAVDGTYPFNAVSQNAAISMSDGGQVVLDASVFATDNDLAAALASLPAEEHLETLNTVGNITTFVSNTGGTIGTLDLSAYANGTDHFLQQPTLVGSTLVFPISSGVSYNLSLAALIANVDEELVDNGDGTFTFTDGDGSQTTFTDAAGIRWDGMLFPSQNLPASLVADRQDIDFVYLRRSGALYKIDADTWFRKQHANLANTLPLNFEELADPVIPGTLDTVLTGTNTHTLYTGTALHKEVVHTASKTYTVADFPMLATAGISLAVIADVITNYKYVSGNVNYPDWEFDIAVNGVIVKTGPDGLLLSEDGNYHTVSDRLRGNFVTTGGDITVSIIQTAMYGSAFGALFIGDEMQIDITRVGVQMELN